MDGNDHKALWVVGTPNGGTSCVAGILHHLGVDMGIVPTIPDSRGYFTFEDERLSAYGLFHFRQYLDDRLGAASGTIGVKCASSAYVDDPDPTTLPVRVILVHRPIEDSIRSMVRVWTQERAEMLRHHGNPFKFLATRAGGIAQAWELKSLLPSVIEPELEIDFYSVLQSPKTAVLTIQHTLGLSATTEQFDAAWRFVDPEMRHV